MQNHRTPGVMGKKSTEGGESCQFDAASISHQLALAQTLQEVGALLISQLDLEEVLEKILDLLGRVIHYDSASIQLFDENQKLKLAAGRGYPNIQRAMEIVSELSDAMTNRPWIDGKVIVISDTTRDEGWIDIPGAEYIRSWAGAPLQVRGNFIGTLNLDSRTANMYDGSLAETILAFANQAAIAIENARLYALQEKRAAELEAIRQASLSLTSSLKLEEVLNAILQSALKLLPNAYNTHIFLYDEKSDILTFGAASWQDGRRGEPFASPRRDGLTSTVARSGRPLVVPDVSVHPIYDGVPRNEDWAGSIVGMPLKIGQRVVGVMNVAFIAPHSFQEAELRLLRLLGDQAAIAIENAHLFEQAAVERRHLRLLYDLGRELATSLNPDQILQRALTLTCEAFSGVMGEGLLYLPDQQRLSLRALYSEEDLSPGMLKNLELRVGNGLAGWVAQQQKAVTVSDLSHNSHWMPIPGLDEDLTSAIVAPILEDNRLHGVISILHHRRDAFNTDHLDLIGAISQQVSLALSNAERYQQVQSLVDLLAVEQRRLESLIEQLPVGVLLLDKEFRLLVANSLAREILDELAKSEVGEVLTHLGSCSVQELVAGNSRQDPVEICCKDSTMRVYEVQAREIGGESPQWTLTIRDVTRERENQMRIHMQERLATVGQLAAGIAHDFNNIMAAILVYTDLLMLDPSASRSNHERLVIIKQQIQRASSMIRQILDFSRRSLMEPSTLDLLPFLKELEKLLHRLLPENIHLRLQSTPGVYLVTADPTRIQQVFMNLALNARDAMPAGGSLFFELDLYTLSSSTTPPILGMAPGTYVRVTVRDTGCGIGADTLSHIFEPFFTTKPVGQGTGLGLAQVYGIIQQHEGFIDVHSQEGQGTEFVIYLPALLVPEGQETLREANTSLDGTGITILLVEDDHSIREAIRSLLTAQNFKVLEARNGRQALDIFDQENERINLVVSDMVMPEMGGMALYEALQKRQASVKMLLITGHPLDSESSSYLNHGHLHWLEKPFSIQDFNQAVMTLMDQR